MARVGVIRNAEINKKEKKRKMDKQTDRHKDEILYGKENQQL